MEAEADSPAPGERSALDEIEAMLRAVRERIDALGQSASDAQGWTEERAGSCQAWEDTAEQLDDLRERMRAAVRMWGNAQRGAGGVMLSLEHNGALVVEEGLRKRESALNGRGADGGGREPAHSGARAAAKPTPKAALPDSLARSLTAQRTTAIVAVLARRPNIALAAVVYQMIAAAHHELPDLPLQIRTGDGLEAATRVAQAPVDSPALVALAETGAEVGQSLPTAPVDLMRHLLDADQDMLLRLLAYCVARRTYAVRGNEWQFRPQQKAVETKLLDALGFDMADWWAPTGPAYLARVPKARLIEAVTETCGAAEAAPLVKMKKAEAVALAENKLKGSRWLPATLRAASAEAAT